jgi:phosphate starvation-inducible PhoH-like protein
MEEKSIFEMILNKEIDSEIIYEDDEIFAIHDINPVAPIHVLIIPKKKIKTINDVTQEDTALIGKLVITAKNLAKSLGIDESGYRLLWNTNKDAMQTVFPYSSTSYWWNNVEGNLMSFEKEIPSNVEVVNILGINDKNLKYIKSVFPNVLINVRGNTIFIEGQDKDAKEIMRIFDEMVMMHDNGQNIEETDIAILSDIKDIQNHGEKKISSISIIENKSIKVKNINQYKYMDLIQNSTVTFGIGPAGTGKTFLAVAAAVKMYSEHKIKKIVLTRPAVEAGERLGYLPGDLSQKIDPYLVPLFDSLEYFFGNEVLAYLIEKRNIEIVPLAYMRGRTLSNACIILDEAQNATMSQIKMFLTRLGENSKIIITGDESQIDLYSKDNSGLKKTRKILSKIDEITVMEFQNTDIVRNPIVSKILEIFPDK